MALRHPFPETVELDLQLDAEPTRAVSVARASTVIEFRRGYDMAKVVEQMRGLRRVRINAAVGAGKSTLLPAALAAATGKPVFHVVPAKLLAVASYDYVSKQLYGKDTALALSPADGHAAVGVTKTYMANVAALVLAKGGVEGAFAEFTGGVYLYLDECHESDGWTYFVRTIAHEMSNVITVIEATATPDPDRMPMAELPGTMTSESYDLVSPTDWDPSEPGKPWSITQLSHNLVIWLDEEETAKRLVEMYSRGGVSAYRLTSRTDVTTFRRAMAQMNDPNSGIVVLVADYTFRSGHSLDFNRAIDTALVKFTTIDNSNQVVRFRYIYETERYQTMHRGARLPGSSCKYYIPKLKDGLVRSAMCDLEGVEAELAVVLFRYAGFLPPASLSTMFMAKGPVPRDFGRAANGSVAFPLLAEHETMPLVRGLVHRGDDVDELLAEYGQADSVEDGVDYFSSVGFDDAVLHAPKGDGLSFLQQLQSLALQNGRMIAGRYYKSFSVPNESVVSSLYGSDWRVALDELQAKPYLVSGFSREQVLELIALFLEQYNVNVAVAAAINAVVESSESLERIALRYPDMVREWTTKMSSQLRESKALQSAFIGVLELLKQPGMEYVPISPDEDMENRLAKSYAQQLVTSVKGANQVVDPDKYLKFIGDSIPELALMEDKGYDKLSVSTDRGTSHLQVRLSPVKGRRSMWSLTFDVPGSLVWGEKDCMHVLQCYLGNTGMSARSIADLKFIGPRVNARRVLADVVAMDEYRHRQPVKKRFMIEPGVDSGGGVGKGVRLIEESSVDVGDIKTGLLERPVAMQPRVVKLR